MTDERDTTQMYPRSCLCGAIKLVVVGEPAMVMQSPLLDVTDRGDHRHARSEKMLEHVGLPSYKPWMQHLDELARGLGMRTEEALLPMRGRARTLLGWP